MQGSFKIDNCSYLKLGAGTRLLLTFIASLTCLCLSNPYAIFILFLASLFYALLEVRLSLIIKVYLAIVAMSLIALVSIALLFKVLPALANSPKGTNILVPFERIAVMVNMVLVMAANSSLSGLTSSLNKIRLPGVIKLPLLVTIRFIPTFFNDIKQLNEAISLRFSRYGGKRFWFRHPILWCRIFFMPLVIRLIRSGDELAVASELKGLTPNIKLGNDKTQVKKSDVIALSVAFFTICISVTVQMLLRQGVHA